MKNKKILLIILVAIVMFLTTGCTNKDGKTFKEEYESINGETNSVGLTYRELDLDEDNKFVYSTAEEIVEMMENKETFYVYFGDEHCPWCRSVINSAIEVSNDSDVKKIYYVKIWDDFHEEVLRDTYKLDDNGKATLETTGTDAYYKLLDLLDNVLGDYTLTDEDGKTVEVGEKRIFAPNFIYIKAGKAVTLVEGISEKQDGYNGELTKEVLADEKKTFTEFFSQD